MPGPLYKYFNLSIGKFKLELQVHTNNPIPAYITMTLTLLNKGVIQILDTEWAGIHPLIP